MQNRTPPPREERKPLPAFAPVPRKCNRHDGWTPPRQRAFIAALADTGSVTRAAAMVNMSTESAYALRRQPGAESFRRAWDAALDFGVARLKDIALERAIEGDLVPVIAGGKLHGYRRVRNDRLLMFAIRMNDRGQDGRRHGASHFQPRDGDKPAASLTLPDLSAAESQDANAGHIAGFLPVPQDPLQQAQVYEALAAEARRRADLPPAENPAEPFLHPHDVEAAGLGPLGSPYADEEDPVLAPGERRWHRLHDEAGAQAIEDAVASVEAAKAAGYFAQPALENGSEVAALVPPRHGRSNPGSDEGESLGGRLRREGDRPAQRDGGGAPPPAPAHPAPKPKRPYKKRTPKPPLEGLE